MLKSGTGVCRIAASSIVSPTRTGPRPFEPSCVLSWSKSCCIRGFRRSASIKSVEEPAWAIAIARLEAVVVFPSTAPGLVTSITFGWDSADESSTPVRIVR